MPGRCAMPARPPSSPVLTYSMRPIMQRRSPRSGNRPRRPDKHNPQMSPQRIDVSPNAEALAHRVAQWIVDLACHNSGRFAVCLSGGSTPRRLYQLLGAPPLRDAMPWQRVHWFWGDERFVPWDHPDSNYGVVRAAMLARVPAPPQNMLGIGTAS